jgi:hypothetical protein
VLLAVGRPAEGGENAADLVGRACGLAVTVRDTPADEQRDLRPARGDDRPVVAALAFGAVPRTTVAANAPHEVSPAREDVRLATPYTQARLAVIITIGLRSFLSLLASRP